MVQIQAGINNFYLNDVHNYHIKGIVKHSLKICFALSVINDTLMVIVFSIIKGDKQERLALLLTVLSWLMTCILWL